MSKRWTWLLVGAIGVVIGIGLASWKTFPTEDMIARTTCAECHDVHGALEIAQVPAQSQVWILGDVPESTYFFVNDLFPLADETEGTSISLIDLLADYGVTDWEKVSIESLDGGLVTLERQYVTENSLLVPYVDGIRFKDVNLHESTWLKGVRFITVQGSETPLLLGDTQTSLGRLLMGDRTAVIAEASDALYSSPVDGQIYQGNYAHIYTGASLVSLLTAYPEATTFACTSQDSETVSYTREELQEAVIAPVSGLPSLVLPQYGQGSWVIGIESIVPEDGES